MKQKNFLKVIIICLLSISSFAQSTGDIAFVGFNAGGNSDFAIVALADISASTTIYFTDDETTGVGTPSALAGSEGVITWNSGSNIIKAGTIIIFTDVDNDSNASFGSSFGSITRSGSFNISGSKDGIIAFIGSDSSTPTTYIAAIQIGNNSAELGPFDGDGITLTNTGLVIGSSIIVADNSASPNGGYFSGSRSNQTSYSAYYTRLETNGNWTTSGSDGESLLPFSQEAFTINTTNWTGTTSSVWNLAGNWDNGIPTSSSLVNIPEVTTAPIITSSVDATVGNLNITETDGLTINDGSLLVNGTSSGNVTYNRTIATSNWYLISSPVVGEDAFDVLINAGDISTNAGGDAAIGTYNDGWTYNYSATLVSGNGYAIKKDASGNLPFTGTLQTSDVALTLLNTTDNFLLFGNPYPSYIAANTNANSVNNLLSRNTNTNQDELDEATIWLWNQATDSYDQINQATASFHIAPGQGFFIKEKSAGSGDGNFDITKSMQSHGTSATLQKNVRPEIKLLLTNQSTSKKSDIYFISGTTKGFDNGYDSSIFGGVSHEFVVYTEAVENGTGKKLGIQSLPNTDYENMVIPIGVIAEANKEIKFSTETTNLPSGINVYLEDRIENTFTQLNEANSEYKITPTEKLDGVGRFYLHTKSSSALSTNDITLEGTNIYQLDKNSLRVTGINSDVASIKIYSILGKQVLDQSFSSKGNSDISLPNLNTGVYIVQIATEKGKTNKKIVLK